MNKKRIIGIISIAFILLIVSVFLISRSTMEKAEAADADTLGAPIEIALVKSGNIQEALNYMGVIKSKNQAELSFKSSGIAKQTHVAEGDYFVKGQVLATLNMDELIARRDMLQQRVASAKLNIDYIKDQADKNNILYNEGAVSYQQLLDINYKYEMALVAYQESLAAAREIEASLKNGQIYAPYDGIVRDSSIQVGEMVQPGQPVFIVSEKDDLLVEIAVIEKDLAAFKVGTKALLSLGNGDSDELIDGTVSAISPALNPQTRTANVEIIIPPGYKTLLPNMSVRVSLVKAEKVNVMVVPVNALVESPEGYTLYVYHEGKALSREVKVGLNNGIMAEIMEGVTVGDQVITTSPTNLKNGDKVFVYKGVE